MSRDTTLGAERRASLQGILKPHRPRQMPDKHIAAVLKVDDQSVPNLTDPSPHSVWFFTADRRGFRRDIALRGSVLPSNLQGGGSTGDRHWRQPASERDQQHPQRRSNGVSPTFPTGPLILEFCWQNLNRIKGRCGGKACSEDLPSFRVLVCA
jgi:hypothetical protein